MNPKPKLQSAIRSAGRAYAAGRIDRATMCAIQDRIVRLEQRWDWMQARNRRRAARDRGRAMLARLRREIEAEGTIIAYDTEFLRNGPVLQLGISVWHAGRITTHTYTTPNYRKPNPPAGRFGHDRIVSHAYVCRLAQRLSARPAVHVFHTGASDIEKLGLTLAPADHVDTALISRGMVTYNERPSLADLARHYGIDPTGHHHAGNDARFTVEIAIALALDPYWTTPASHAHAWADQVESLNMMAPTRQPRPNVEDLKPRRQAILKRLRADLRRDALAVQAIAP